MASKKIPQNIEVEKALLGAMIISTAIFGQTLGDIEADDFYDRKNRTVFEAIMSLFDKKQPIDATTVATELANIKKIDEIGGAEYLLELSDMAVTYTNLKHYINILQETSTLRKLLLTMEDISQEYSSKKINEISDFVTSAEEKINQVTKERRVAGLRDIKKVTDDFQKEFETVKKSVRSSGAPLLGVTTGFPSLNNIIYGFKGGEFIILAARTGIGKTAFALNLAYNAALKGNVPVAIFSLEMPDTQLMKRLVALESGVPHESLTTGFVKRDDNFKIEEACKRINHTKMYVHDTPGIKAIDILAKCRQLKNKEPDLALVIVDHIGLVTPDKNASSRQEAVQGISIYLKRIAMELNVAVIGIAQLNREVDKNPAKSPELFNLRESGSLEQDADIVLLMQVDSAYGSQDKNASKGERAQSSVAQTIASKENPAATMIKIKVAKNRSGKIANFHLLFNKNTMLFSSISQETQKQLDNMEQQFEEENY